MKTLTVTRNGTLDQSYYNKITRERYLSTLKGFLAQSSKYIAIHIGDGLYKACDDLTKTNYRSEYRELVGLPVLETKAEKLAQLRNSYGRFM